MREEAPAASPSEPCESVNILMVAALLREVRSFLRRAAARPRGGLGAPAWELALSDGAAVMLLAGVGPEAAARTAALALARCRPRTLISLGFGGALTPEAAPGTLVLGERFRQYDPDRGILAAAPGPAPPRLLAGLVRRLRDAGLPSLTGTIITAPRILHKAAEAGPLMELPCPVLDLESAPLAAAAAERGLAFLGLRAVTDGAGEEIPEFIREACRRGAEPGPAAAFAWAARDPRRLLMLLRLWRRSRLAGRLLARALEVLLPVL